MFGRRRGGVIRSEVGLRSDEFAAILKEGGLQMPTSIYSVPQIMDVMEVISEKEENRYSDIPGWTGNLMSWTDAAVLLVIEHRAIAPRRQAWFPMSQLRRSEDGQSVYASQWIIEQKGLA